MEVRKIVVGVLATNCYVVVKEAAAIVIDPGAQARKVLKAVEGLDVRAVLLTHAHNDHTGALEAVAAAMGAPVFVGAGDLVRATAAAGNATVRVFEPGARWEGGDMAFDVIATPGHTAGSVCYYAEGTLFSGDTLFAGGIGRTDLPGGSEAAIFASIRDRLFTLPRETLVLPGHGPGTSIDAEIRDNPFFGPAGK